MGGDSPVPMTAASVGARIRGVYGLFPMNYLHVAGINKPVTDAPDVDHKLVVAAAAELPGKPVPVAVDGTGAPPAAVIPDVAQQLGARVAARRVASQRA